MKSYIARISERLGFGSSSRSANGKAPSTARLALENLEARELLSVSPLDAIVPTLPSADERVASLGTPLDEDSISCGALLDAIDATADAADDFYELAYPTPELVPDSGDLYALDPAPNAQTLVVTSTNDSMSDTGSLRYLLSVAQDGDTIKFNSSLNGKTITLDGSALEINEKSVSILAETTAGVSVNITIDANNRSRVFYIHRDNSVGSGAVYDNITLKGLNLKNGYTSESGGGIYKGSRSHLTIKDCSISHCNGQRGSGLYMQGTANNSSGSLTLERCTISDNYANHSGGGVYIAGGTALITHCNISNNSIGNYNSYINGTSLGGGIAIDAGSLTIHQSLISENSSGSYGGGIAISGSGVGNIYSSTITSNTAKYGGGGVATKCSTAIYNSIIVNNSLTDSEDNPDILNRYSEANIRGYNTLSTFNSWNSASSCYVYSASQPLFANASGHNYTLASNSQAIDKGDNSYVSHTTDLAGKTRIANGTVDLGAYEYQTATKLSSPTVLGTSTQTSVTLSWTSVAHASGYQIVFNGQTYSLSASTTSRTFSNLTKGTQYTFLVRAKGDGTNYTDSNDVSYTISTKNAAQLDRPTLTSSAQTTSSITVNWGAIANASSYTLSYAVKATAPTYRTVSLGATKTSYTITGLNANTNYYVKIRANGDGTIYTDSEESAVITVKTKANAQQLAAPTVTGTASATAITLRWNEVAHASGYAIVFNGSTRSLSASTTSYTFTGLTESTQYAFVVRAKGDGTTYTDSPDVSYTISTTSSVETPSIIVTTTEDVVDSHDGKISLREAIQYSSAGDTIRFDASLDGKTITLNGSQLKISGKSISIVAETPAGEALDICVDANNRSRVFNIVGSTSNTNALNVILQGLRMTNANLSTSYGGAVAIENAVAMLINCEISSSVAYFGGGVHATSSDVTLMNCAVVSCSASADGGGVYVDEDSNVKLYSCTIASNNANSGGGVGAGGIATLYNTIVARNTAQKSATAGDVSLIGTSGQVRAYNVLSSFSNWTASSSCYVDNTSSPLFANAAAGDYTLATNSQGIDKGNNSYLYPDVDLASRKRVDGGRIDLGAYEYQRTSFWTVTTTEDSIKPLDGKITLREAIKYAKNADTIRFATALNGETITLDGNCLEILNKSLTIAAENPDGVKMDIEISGGGESRVFYINNVNSETDLPSVTLKGLRITNGLAGEYEFGGGVCAASADLTMIDCGIETCEAYNGGGVAASYSTLTLQGTTIENCVASSLGGGLYANYSEIAATNSVVDGCVSDFASGGVSINVSSMTLTNSFVVNCSATSGAGGVGTSHSDFTAINDVFANNVGSGIYADYSSAVEIYSSTITGNASNNGGGIFAANYDNVFVDVFNSIVVGNTTLTGSAASDVGKAGASAKIGGYNTLSTFNAWDQRTSCYIYDPSAPLFLDATNGDYALAPNSQAIDKGDNDLITAEFDLAGATRVVNGIVDLGAYEYQGGTTTRLAAPTVSGESTATTITLVWTAVAHASGYEIDFNGTTYSVEASTTSRTFEDLAQNTQYSFVLRAKGDGAIYTDSADVSVSISTGAIQQLDRPTLTSTSQTSSSITLNWDAIANAKSYTISYAVKSSSPAYSTATVVATRTSYTLRNLAPNTSYYVKIRANGDGVEYSDSPQSPTITVKTLNESEPQALDAPTVSGNATTNSITLNWTPVANASGYEIDFNEQIYEIDASTTSYTFNGLTKGTEYSFILRAISDGINFLDSDDVAFEISTTNVQQLDRPRLTTTAQTSSTITVAWETIANAKSYTISYAVKSSTPVYKTVSLGASKTNYMLRDLEADTNYYVKIRANGDGVEFTNSPQSPTITVKTKPTLSQLDAPTISTAATASTITLSWTPVLGASGYEIDFNGTTYAIDAATTSRVFTGLNYSTSHNFVARAIGDGVSYLDSEDVAVSVATTALVQLARPALVATGATANAIDVAWETIPGASSYTISYAVKATNPSYNAATLGASKTSYTIRNLEPGTSYYLKIRANGDNVEYKNSAQSPTITVKTASDVTTLAIPTITGTSATAATITVNWSTVSGAAGYELLCGSQSATVASDATSYTFTGLTANTSYSIKAKALGNGTTTLDSAYSDVATQSTTALVQLARPALTATATTTDSIAVAWETIPGASSYTISYAVKASSPVYKTATLGATKTNYTIRGLESGTSYYLKIRANGDNVEYKNSAQSPTITVKTTADVVTLAAPTITATSATATTITVQWNDVSGAAGYELVCGSQSATVASDATSYTFTGLTANTSYSIKAKALGNGTTTLDSPYSDVATKSTTALVQLARPTLTATATTTDSIAVAWETIPGASSYTISYAVKASSPVYKTATLGATKTNYTIRNLESGTSYYLKIRANGDNVEYRDSAQSPTITVKTTADVVTLAAPTITATSATAATIAVQWNDVSGAAGYELVCGSQSATVASDATSYTFTGLTANTSYTIKAKALGNGTTTLDSPYSDVATKSTTALVQLARPALTATATTTDSIAVAWETIPGASSYTISYAVKASSPVYKTATLGATKTSYTIRNLESGTSYYLKIRANGDNVEYRDSAQSPTITVKTTADVVTLAAPTITATSATAATIAMNWSPVSGAAGYELLCGSQSATVASDATSYTFTGLTANTSYSIKAKALGNGTTTLDSPYSDVATQKTTALVQLARPALTATATTTDSIAVAWETIPGASSYTISYAVKASSPVYKTATLGATKTGYTIRGLESNTSYYLKIRANGDNVEYKDSSQSPTITAKTAVNVVALDAPTITAISATTTAITLKWSPVQDAAGYAILCGTRTISGVSANATSYTITGLTANTNYSAQIKAVGNGSTTIDSPYSEAATVKTAALVQLARPTLVVESTWSDSIEVSWQAVPHASSYTLSFAVKATSPVYTEITLDANATSCMIGDLLANTSYYIKIRANGDNVEYANSAQSATQTARTAAANSLALLDESTFDDAFDDELDELLALNWLD